MIKSMNPLAHLCVQDTVVYKTPVTADVNKNIMPWSCSHTLIAFTAKLIRTVNF